MKQSIVILLISCSLLLVGCSEGSKRTSIEDLGMVSSIAFDVANDKEMKMTVSVPHPTTELPKNTQTYSVDTQLIQEGLVEVSSQADQMIILNQLRTLLFSEELARKGQVAEVIEHFYRNSTVGNNVRIAIVKDRAEDYLKADFPDKPNIDTYLNDLLQPTHHTSFSPFTTLHDFQYSETNPIYFSMTPYLEIEKDSFKIASVALFDRGKMLDKIAPKEALIVEALTGKGKLPPLTIKPDELSDKEQLQIQLVKNKVKITGNRNIEAPKLKIALNLQGTLYEYKGDKDLGKIKEYKELETEVSKYVKKDVEDVIKKLQELEVDPVGFSEYFRMYHKGRWTEELSKKIMDSAEFKVTVDFKLLNTGALK